MASTMHSPSLSPTSSPDWLKTDEENQSARDWETLERAEGDADVPDDGTTSRTRGGRYRVCFIIFVSSILACLFIYATIVQNNDPDSLQWFFFYGMHAALPVLFLYHYFICFPPAVVYSLSISMVVWSILLIVIAGLKLGDTPKDSDEEGTGDGDTKTLREELIFELAGAALGLLSALYHSFVMGRCSNKDGREE